MTELEAAERFIYSLLNVTGVTDLVGTRIYPNTAPQGAALPYVVFQWMGGSDSNSQEKTRVETYNEYLVKAIDEDHDTLGVHAIAAAIDTAMHHKFSTANGFRLSSHRISPFSMPEESGGNLYQHSGGRYRILLRKNF